MGNIGQPSNLRKSHKKSSIRCLCRCTSYVLDIGTRTRRGDFQRNAALRQVHQEEPNQKIHGHPPQNGPTRGRKYLLSMQSSCDESKPSGSINQRASASARWGGGRRSLFDVLHRCRRPPCAVQPSADDLSEDGVHFLDPQGAHGAAAAAGGKVGHKMSHICTHHHLLWRSS